ncbi:hypothetical protein [Azorhizobium doebereinerae]|uniref:hypothetical protein n=1 Tax=Azorhizobium doebereinerae TaxID=281091 RepID=UPI0012EBB21F|nr:hypothetical protein [Azorhizobium doebereinerae]
MKKVTDYASPWYKIPKEALAPLPPEQKKELADREAAAKKLEADAAKLIAQHQSGVYGEDAPSILVRKDVSALSLDQTVDELEIMTRLSKANFFKNVTIEAHQGDNATDSVSTYMTWLQERVTQLGTDGTYSQF